MNKTTDKDIFDIITKHLIEQGERSFGSSGQCAYRGYKRETIREVEREAIEMANDDYPYSEVIDDLLSSIPFNAKCAVGAIIKDEFYHLGLENNPAGDEVVIAVINKSYPDWNITYNSRKMLTILQNIHDSDKEEFKDFPFLFDSDGNYLGQDYK